MWRQDMNYETQAATFFLSFLSLIAFHYHLQVTPSPCLVLWPASVARVYLLPTLSFVPLVVVCRAVTWGPFGIYLGAAFKSFFEHQCVVRCSEVNPMKCSLFYQPYASIATPNAVKSGPTPPCNIKAVPGACNEMQPTKVEGNSWIVVLSDRGNLIVIQLF